MSHIDGTCEFELSGPLKYSAKGAFKETLCIELHEPDSTKRKQCMRMRKIVKVAEVDIATKLAHLIGDATQQRAKPLHEQEEDEYSNSAEDRALVISNALDVGGDEDAIDKFADCFAKMLESPGKPIAFVAEGVPMKRSHFDEMDMFDQVEIAVQYAAFFGIASDKTQRKTSGAGSEQPMQAKAL